VEDSSEGSAHPNRVSSTGTPVLDRDAPHPLTSTLGPTDDLGAAIKANFDAARELNKFTNQRGRSWALDGRNPALGWVTRTRWLVSVDVALASKEGQRLCRERHLSPATARAIARSCAHYADSRNGRGVTASNRTLGALAAARTGRRRAWSHDVVANARAVLAALGLAVEVVRGRYLDAGERTAAALHHGGSQLRAASTWALVIPRRLQQKSSLPRRGSTGSKTPRRNGSPNTRAQARAGAPSGRDRSRERPKRPIEAQRTTAELLVRVRTLDDGRHLGPLVDVVAEHVDCTRWSGHDLAQIIDQHTRKAGLVWPDRIVHPARFLRAVLGRLGPRLDEPTPTEVARQRHELVLQEQRERREESERATRNAASPETVRRHMAEIRATLERRRGRRDN